MYLYLLIGAVCETDYLQCEMSLSGHILKHTKLAIDTISPQKF